MSEFLFWTVFSVFLNTQTNMLESVSQPIPTRTFSSSEECQEHLLATAQPSEIIIRDKNGTFRKRKRSGINRFIFQECVPVYDQ